ncbi:hypothetical protein HanIR_Chr14g0688061 [Helianthus annuus]|nr:hypothetical protein HanIR_Chr14g0688061 [Helianthus annuus]
MLLSCELMNTITRLLCAVMGLKDALRLKSFDSTELDVRATKTPKGDPPYLSVHLSVEDEEVNVEGGDEGDDEDVEAHPQVSLKRGRTTSSKADPNPKTLKKKKKKKKKLDFKTITLDDDEVDQVKGFSSTGGLLDNLDAHLHSGRTPRDRPINLPTSPISFGGPTTKVIEDIHMPDPLSFKKIEPSPSGKPTTGVASNVSRPSPQLIDGGDSASSSPLWYETEAVFICRELGSGDAVDVDPAHALEKYVPEWSLANKDRIMDALSAKMALFHLGTPAEHAYYRKMSGPELGNALMLNQAQSNSLVHKAELKRARDSAVKSHQETIDEAKGMLSRCDGEMIELYALVSELMLTKQWFLTDGVAWVVKLVHQSPELEKVVADLVNSVNAVGVNEGIKQGFQAAKDSGSLCRRGSWV